MTDDEKQYWDGKLAKINDLIERVLNRLNSVERDFTNTKGFLINDAVVSGSRWLDLEHRVSRIERDLKA